jgi:DNA-binding transcriptional LysR family regulator
MSRFNIQSLDLNLLSVFVILWETRSVSRASVQLSLTQPAVSHALKRLRDRLNDPLFLPDRYGLVPTPRAIELIAPVRDALNSISTALANTAPFDPTTTSAEFRIATTDVVESWLIPLVLKFTEERASNATICSVPLPDFDAIRMKLEVGDIDLAMVQDRLAGNNIRCEQAAKIQLVTMQRREAVKRTAKLTLKDFLKKRHVVLQRRLQPGGGTVDAALKAMGYARRIGAEVKTLHAMMASASRTDLLCTVPIFMSPYAAAFGLSVHQLPFSLKPITLYIAWHARCERDPATVWLLEIVRAAVAHATGAQAKSPNRDKRENARQGSIRAE